MRSRFHLGMTITNTRDTTMTARLDPVAAAPELMKIWRDAAVIIAASLEPSLAELVKIRASQINGCANCINPMQR